MKSKLAHNIISETSEKIKKEVDYYAKHIIKEKYMNKVNIALGAVIILLSIGIGIVYSQLSKTKEPNYDYYLHQIDSLSHKIDTVEIEETKTVIRYKTKTINEIIYITASNDTQQLTIRANLRHDIDRSITE